MRAIDADALIGQLHFIEFEDGDDRSLVYAIIQRQPTIEPERKKGKWIKVRPISGDDIEAYMCPFCNTGDWDISADSYNYCPYCGKSVSGVADDPSHPFADDVMMKGEEI